MKPAMMPSTKREKTIPMANPPIRTQNSSIVQKAIFSGSSSVDGMRYRSACAIIIGSGSFDAALVLPIPQRIALNEKSQAPLGLS